MGEPANRGIPVAIVNISKHGHPSQGLGMSFPITRHKRKQPHAGAVVAEGEALCCRLG